MRSFLLSGLLAFTYLAFGQKTGGQLVPQYKTGNCKSSFIKMQLQGKPGIDAVEAMLTNTAENLKDSRSTLKLNYINQSPGGRHYSFTQLFNGVPVYQSEIKVNVDNNNVVRSIFDNSYNTSGWQLSAVNTVANTFIAINPKTNAPVIVQRSVLKNHLETLTTTSGEVIFQTDLNCYLNGTDSTATGLVFNPDPLTTAQHIYTPGTIYVSAGDTDAPWLDAQEQNHSFTAHFENDTFRLQSAFVQLAQYDTFAPDVQPVTSTTGQFNYNRSQTGFQDVNAFYHISTYHDYVHSLGFNLADSFLQVDTHAFFDDNSYFTYDYYPCRIYYGTGGVPDADDADVIVHEYCHFLSYTAAPQSNQGYERRSLDEGFCDYNAASYSKNISTFYDYWVYNWDGHNQYWPGRIVNSTTVYPGALDGDIYDNGQMWSSALFALQDDLGRQTVDSLILQTNYSYAINISMADAAQLLIDADTILFAGAHYCPIYNRLLEHGFVTLSEKDNCALTAIDEQTGALTAMRFMQHGNWFTLATNSTAPYTLQILSITGQQAAPVINSAEAVYNYQNPNLPAGVYIANVLSGNTRQTFKWVNTGR